MLEYCKSCDSYQQVSGLKTMSLVKLIISLLEEPFMKWDSNFIGSLKLVNKHTGNKYILVTMNYATKWVEVRTLQTNIIIMTTKFSYKCIFTWFGCPLTLVTYQGVHFINDDIMHMIEHFLLKHTNSTTYYQQGNGYAKSTNKIIKVSLTKLVNKN